ncbi:hypothetical protein MLD38_012296 [Melastoma candidum]|uniref:Uncharacterized protein n=1 Tax=Melastoma candidum TaxID=119954 RepID=A0ACB9R6G6_9MYRT|nr:hypothetical protein MLD38_012296 [Melastoma candidum]
MVKAYLRYEPAAAFGVIASPDSNIAYDATGKHLLSPALEKVGVWHVRQGACIRSLSPSSSSSSGPSLAVTCIATSSPSSPSLFASGYADGSIRIWDFEKGSCETTLNGHKGAVSAIRYGKLGSLFASGSKDNDIILWDLVGEAGLYRLCGHRDQVTDLVFLDSDKKLVSSSKDKYLRVWDLETQHCMQIVGGHHSEIWSIDVDPKEVYLVTGSADPELRFYTIKSETIERVSASNGPENSDGDSSSNSKWEVLKSFGEIQRQSKDRVATLRFNSSGSLLACQVAGKIVEVFRVLDETEAKRKAKRRLQRKKEKKGATDVGVNVDAGQGTSEIQTIEISVPDIFKLLQTIRAGKKICSASFCPVAPKKSLAIVALSLNNNVLELHSIEASGTSKTHSIELQGHRSVVRSVTLSSDNSLLMSTSHDTIKFWNPSTGVCLRTVESGYGLCGIIVPQNKYSIIGTKAGAIEIIDIGSGTRVEVVEAHGGSIPSIVAIPNENGFITGSSDRDVKFWEYGMKQQPDQSSKQLTVSNVRTLKMDEDVVVVGVSPDGQKIAVALLNSTVKVFFMDSLKPAHTLYGHKLPVLCLDISSDGDLIVTGSADKNLMIWGLDFGDRHKAIFAHADSVLAVRFVRNTHYVFSAGKDRLLKYWDADKFELLLTIQGHHAAILGLAVSSRGDFVVTGSHDRSIRRWDRTDEPFFIEEEKEKRLEEMFENDLDSAFGNRFLAKEEIPEEGAVAIAGKKTQETLTATDSIIEALDLADIELKRITEYEEEKSRGKVGEFQPNFMMLGLSPSDYVLRALTNVQSNDLEQTLLGIPFSDSLKILSYLKDWSSYPDKIEVVSKVATVLLQTHHHQLISTPSARPLLITLKEVLHERIKGCKDTIGFNLAAMDHMKQLMAMKSDALFQDAKAKLSEIRSQLSKRAESREDPRQEKRRKKKQKKSGDLHALA